MASVTTRIKNEDEARAATTRRTLEDLEAFAGHALPLIDALAQLPNAATWFCQELLPRA
jgi:hypothetical protein